MVFDRKLIAINYVTGWFWIDTLTSLRESPARRPRAATCAPTAQRVCVCGARSRTEAVVCVGVPALLPQRGTT